MTLNIPQIRMEIARATRWFDDNWIKQWTKTTGGTSSFTSDGDTAFLDKGNQSYVWIEHMFPERMTWLEAYYISLLIKAISGVLTLYYYSGGSWVEMTFWYEPGHVTTGPDALSYVYGLAIKVDGSNGGAGTAQICYLHVSSDGYWTPNLEDIFGNMEVVWPVVSRGTSSLDFSLNNFDDAYDDLLTHGDFIMLYLARDAGDLYDSAHKVFGGRISGLRDDKPRYGEKYLHVSAHGHGAELDYPPALMHKNYSGWSGKSIIEQALDYCNVLGKHPVSSNWFSSGGSTDDDIASAFTMIINEEKLSKPVKQILDDSKNAGGVQGFDMVVLPSGAVIGHLRESLDFVCPITPDPFTYDRFLDAHSVINKQKVFGCFGDVAGQNEIPHDDLWCEILSGWSMDYGTVSLETSDKHEGNASIRLTAELIGGGVYRIQALHSLLPYYEWVAAKEDSSVPNAFLRWVSWQKPLGLTFPVDAQLKIYAPDYANYFYVYPGGVYIPSTWTPFSNEIGSSAGWSSFGDPTWKNITALCLRFGDTAAFDVLIDSMALKGGRTFETAEDANSQEKYGVRVGEPVIDEALTNRVSCGLRAQSLVNQAKDMKTTVKTLPFDGDHRFRPGDRHTITPLSLTRSILEVRHVVSKCSWDSVLTVATEPTALDLVFKSLFNRK